MSLLSASAMILAKTHCHTERTLGAYLLPTCFKLNVANIFFCHIIVYIFFFYWVLPKYMYNQSQNLVSGFKHTIISTNFERYNQLCPSWLYGYKRQTLNKPWKTRFILPRIKGTCVPCKSVQSVVLPGTFKGKSIAVNSFNSVF